LPAQIEGRHPYCRHAQRRRQLLPPCQGRDIFGDIVYNDAERWLGTLEICQEALGSSTPWTPFACEDLEINYGVGRIDRLASPWTGKPEQHEHQ
jgi:hypothetical protein